MTHTKEELKAMNKSNTPPFYVGEEVEYITGNSMPKGTKVIITDIWQRVCGCWFIMHDKSSQQKTLDDALLNGCTGWLCVACRKPLGRITYYGWAASSFRRIQRPKPMTFVKLAEIIEQEKEEVLTLN